MNLFIVESPTKAKTIRRILGKGFVVKATFGHVKDLPVKELGVDEETLEPRYVYIKKKRKLMEYLKSIAKRSEAVYIGTDPDREGEAMAYLLKEELIHVNTNIKRVLFYEITREAIEKAMEDAGDINMNLVYSQRARRILDRLIGYKLSPVLWKTFKNRKLSVGRVQSPSLRLIVERERDIQSFKAKSYYYVKAVLEKDGNLFEALYDYRYESPSDAKDIAMRLEEGLFVVSDVRVKKDNLPPPKPFVTSTLQSEANARLGFPAEKTQFLAQKLYEKGLITYPRTDSFRFSPKKAKEFMNFIAREFGPNYVGRLRRFRKKAIAQEAHECIRTTSPRRITFGGDRASLYELILSRTLATLMSDMIVERREVIVRVISPNLRRAIDLKAKGLSVLFRGWSIAYRPSIEEKKLPELSPGDVLKVVKVYVEERKTSPPPRYTEGSLVKTLDKLGIGRPSTYAVTVSTLKKRGYVFVSNGTLRPTDVAFAVVDFLLTTYPALMDYRFTALMERALDEVEEGKRDWKETAKELFKRIL